MCRGCEPASQYSGLQDVESGLQDVEMTTDILAGYQNAFLPPFMPLSKSIGVRATIGKAEIPASLLDLPPLVDLRNVRRNLLAP